nr:hypothetical protein [Tanacetum cinerariifolium]
RACWLLGIDGEGRGSGVEVVEWTGEEERVVLRGWRKNLVVVNNTFQTWER